MCSEYCVTYLSGSTAFGFGWQSHTKAILGVGCATKPERSVGEGGLYIAGFIASHPTIKMLALSFVMMIGVFLVAEGFGFHVPKGYLYFGMAFSLGVESLNMLVRKRRTK